MFFSFFFLESICSLFSSPSLSFSFFSFFFLVEKYPLVNPFQLFEHGAFHGGVSRCAFKVGSIGEAAVISFYLKKFGFGILSFLVGATAVGHWVVTGDISPF